MVEGHDVRVVTGFPHYPEWRLKEGYSGWTYREVVNGVEVLRLRHFIPKNVNHWHRMHLELSYGLRAFFANWRSPDVVIAVSPALFASGLVLLRAKLTVGRNVPVGIWVQDIYSRGLEETGSSGVFTAKLMKLIEALILRSATRVSVIHNRFADYIRSSLSVPPRKVGVIRNWTHVSPPPAFDRENFRASQGWQQNEIVVLHAGNMGVKQALDNVVAAAKLADKRHSSVRFVLLGDGNQRGQLESQARGVKRVQFISPMTDVEFAKMLRSADILLVNEMRGLKEMAVPSKLTSYFASGVPVIAATEEESTTAGEIASSLAGVRVSPESAEDLLAAAERVGSDEPLALALGAAGIRYAETVLSQEEALVQYSKWLNELSTVGRA